MWPAAHAAQVPHEIWNGTTTTSPGATPRTASPISTTSATHSCPSGNGSLDRDHAGEERGVEVAHRHGERPHERLAVALQRGRGHLAPAHRARARDLELPHAYVGASRNGMTAGASSGDMKTS